MNWNGEGEGGGLWRGGTSGGEHGPIAGRALSWILTAHLSHAHDLSSSAGRKVISQVEQKKKRFPAFH